MIKKNLVQILAVTLFLLLISNIFHRLINLESTNQTFFQSDSNFSYIQALWNYDHLNIHTFNSQSFLPRTLIKNDRSVFQNRQDYFKETKTSGLWLTKPDKLNSLQDLQLIQNDGESFKKHNLIQKVVEDKMQYNHNGDQITFNIIVISTFERKNPNTENKYHQTTINQIFAYHLENGLIISDLLEVIDLPTLFRIKAATTYSILAILNDKQFVDQLNNKQIFELEFAIDSQAYVYIQDFRIFPGFKLLELISSVEQEIKIDIIDGDKNFLQSYDFGKKLMKWAPYDYNYRTKHVFVRAIPNTLLVKQKFQEKGYHLYGGQAQAKNLYIMDIVFRQDIDESQIKNGVQMSGNMETIEEITDKAKMFNNLQLARKQLINPIFVQNFIPQTMILNFELFTKHQIKKSLERFQNFTSYIWKETNNFGGFGSMIFKDKKAIEDKIDNYTSKNNIVLQEMINNPFLLDNKKIDFRLFMMIVSADPLIILYSHGYYRKSYSDFDPNSTEILNQITNINQKMSLDQSLEEFIGTMDMFEDYAINIQKKINKEGLNYLYRQIQKLLIQTFLAAKPKMKFKKGKVQLLGADVLITDDFKPILLEINKNVFLQNKTKSHEIVCTRVASQFIDTSEYIFDQSRKGLEIKIDDYMKHCQNCTLLYDERNKYNILDQA